MKRQALQDEIREFVEAMKKPRFVLTGCREERCSPLIVTRNYLQVVARPPKLTPLEMNRLEKAYIVSNFKSSTPRKGSAMISTQVLILSPAPHKRSTNSRSRSKPL